jgi:hypothetical protein
VVEEKSYMAGARAKAVEESKKLADKKRNQTSNTASKKPTDFALPNTRDTGR